jgi:hypothetical protein
MELIEEITSTSIIMIIKILENHYMYLLISSNKTPITHRGIQGFT